LEATPSIPVAALLADDLDIRKLFFDHLFDSIGTPDGGFIAQLTHQDDDISLAAHCFTKFLHVHDPGINGVGTAIHDTLRQVRRKAVDVDQRLTGLDHGLGHRSGCSGIHWKDDYRVHSLCKEVFHLPRLFGGVIVCIDYGQVDIGVFTAPLGYGVSDQGQPHIVEKSHANADFDL
jgi:hypothetical protein